MAKYCCHELLLFEYNHSNSYSQFYLISLLFLDSDNKDERMYILKLVTSNVYKMSTNLKKRKTSVLNTNKGKVIKLQTPMLEVPVSNINSNPRFSLLNGTFQWCIHDMGNDCIVMNDINAVTGNFKVFICIII